MSWAGVVGPRRFLCGSLLVAVAMGGCRCDSRRPAAGTYADDPSFTPLAPAVSEPPVAAIESDYTVVYPQAIELRGEDKRIRPRVVVAVPGADADLPPTRVLVSGWRAGTTEPLLALVDIVDGRIVWSSSQSCRGDVVAATSSRAICSSGAGVDGIDLSNGARLWASPLRYQAAGEGAVMVADGQGVSVLEAESGELQMRLPGPPQRWQHVRKICKDADSGHYILLSWSDAGEVEVFSIGVRERTVARQWAVAVAGTPVRADECQQDQVRLLLTSRGERMWASFDLRDGRELSTTVVGDDVVARDWASSRVLVRRQDGRLTLGNLHRGTIFLGAPVHAGWLFMTGDHVLAAGRDARRSAAESLTLYRLPSVDVGAVVPPPPTPAVVDPVALPDRGRFDASVTFPGSDDLVPSRTYLAADTLWISAGTPVATVVPFDLRTRSFGPPDRELCSVNALVVGLAVADGVIACATRENEPAHGWVRGRPVSGGTPWARRFLTVDELRVAGRYLVAIVGSVAVVIEPTSGETFYQVRADNGFVPRFAAVGSLVVHAEAGRLVARDPRRRGEPVWSVAIRGYPVGIAAVGDRVVAAFVDGRVVTLAADHGTPVPAPALAHEWLASAGDLWIDGPPARAPSAPVSLLRGRSSAGTVRFSTALPLSRSHLHVGLRGDSPAAPVVVEDQEGEERLIALDPISGRPLAVVATPRRRKLGTAFAVAADEPTIGMVSGRPLAVHLMSVRGRASPDAK